MTEVVRIFIAICDTKNPNMRQTAFLHALPVRQVDLKPDEILFKVLVPFSRANEYIKEFKQSPRREDDIAIVNAGMRVRLEKEGDEWFVAEAAFAFGGVAAKAIMAKEVAKEVIGKPWNQQTIEVCIQLKPRGPYTIDMHR